MEPEQSDSDDDTALFGVSLAGLADALSEAAAGDEAEAMEVAAATAAVGAVASSLQEALLSGDLVSLEEALSTLSEGERGGEQTDGITSAVAGYAASVLSGAKAIAGGRYLEVLANPCAGKLMAPHNCTSADMVEPPAAADSVGSSGVLPAPVALVRSRVLAYVLNASSDLEGTMRCAELLLVGVASLNLFLQANYTGPDLPDSDLPQAPAFSAPPVVAATTPATAAATATAAAAAAAATTAAADSGLALLSVDGETPYAGASGPQLLLTSRVVLATLADPTFPLWHVPVATRRDQAPPHSESVEAAGTPPAAVSRADAGSAAEKGVLDAPDAFNERQRMRGVSLKCLRASKPLQPLCAWWSARAAVGHQRLLLAGGPTQTLWVEVRQDLGLALHWFAGCSDPKAPAVVLARAAEEAVDAAMEAAAASSGPSADADDGSKAKKRSQLLMLAVECWLEFGLAHYHFEKADLGKACFRAAQHAGGLEVLMTGEMGKRTKYQRKSTAQMVLKASKKKTGSSSGGVSATAAAAAKEREEEARLSAVLPKVMVQAEDSILLERVKLDGKSGDKSGVQAAGKESSGESPLVGVGGGAVAEGEEEEEEEEEMLSGELQAVLLALCLDVKNSNPKDGLTTEEMRPYVDRVLLHHKNWTIYSTGLLQRAWLDFESHYAKDRATLQLQALVDQHGQALTFTQMSRDAIEESAPAQDRLRHLHCIVYPPRWELRKDLAQRYKTLGILMSAVEIFVSLELWDDAVECFARMGKKKEARALVAEAGLKALGVTPRMLCALGDLSTAPESTEHYEKAWSVSQGRYAKAQRCLGREAVNLADAASAREQAENAKGSAKNQNQLKHADRTVDLSKALEHAGECRHQLNSAERHLELSLSLQPGHTSDWFVLGTVRMRLAHLEGADAKITTEAAAASAAGDGVDDDGGASSSSSSSSAASSALTAEGATRLRFQGALTAFSTVVAHSPDEGDAWGNVGAIHMHLKRFDLAVSAFTEGLKASRESWRMWENRLVSALQVKAVSGSSMLKADERLHYAGDAVYSATQLLDLHQRRGMGRGVDTPMLAAIVSMALKAEGCGTADASSTAKQLSALAPPLCRLNDALTAPSEESLSEERAESLAGPHLFLRPVARKCGELLALVANGSSKGSSPDSAARAWEVCAIFDLALGRRNASRKCRLKHVRALSSVTGWEKRAAELEGLAHACAELVFVHSLPTTSSSSSASAALPPAPSATASAALSAAASSAAATSAAAAAAAEAAVPSSALLSPPVVPTGAAVPPPTEAQQLYAVAALLKGLVKKSQGFGAAGVSGDQGRAKLEECLKNAEALLCSLEEEAKK